MAVTEIREGVFLRGMLAGGRWRAAIGQGAVVFVGYGVIALVGMVGLRLYTELAPKSVFGTANLLLTLLTLGIQLLVAPFTNTQLRYYTEAEAHGAGAAFTREALIWSLRAACVLGGAALMACLLWNALSGATLGAAAACLAVPWALVTATRNVLIGRLQAERRRLAATGLMVAEALFTTGFTAAALWLQARTDFYLAGQVLGLAAFVLLVMRFTPWPLSDHSSASHTCGRNELRSGEDPVSTGFRERAIRYGLPFAPVAVVAWLSNLADRYVLGIVLGAAAVGQYVAPLALASRVMILASGALADLFRPVLFDAANQGQHARATKVFMAWLTANAAIGCVAVVVTMSVGDMIVSALLGEAYRSGAVATMVWVAVGYAVFGMNQVLETRLMSLGRTGRLLAPVSIGAIANIALSVWLVSRRGILGAAQASCLSFTVQCIATALILTLTLQRRQA